MADEKKEYRAAVDFHHDGKHYPKGKGYAGKDAEKLSEQGLVEEGKADPKVVSKHFPMRVERKAA
jgi:hypothetical protein